MLNRRYKVITYAVTFTQDFLCAFYHICPFPWIQNLFKNKSNCITFAVYRITIHDNVHR